MAATLMVLKSGRSTEGDTLALGKARIREDITVAGTSAAQAAAGEYFQVYNGEATAILIAWGPTPDASLTTASPGVSSAGVVVPSGALSDPIAPAVGDKLHAKAYP